MARVNVTHTIGDLARDLGDIAKQAPKDMRDVVREGARVGNSVAKDFAKVSAGAHGKHYHKAFSSEMTDDTDATFAGEYGPDVSKPQGGMSFEHGSRNQKPHLDLARSADLIVPAFQGEVHRLPERWFW